MDDEAADHGGRKDSRPPTAEEHVALAAAEAFDRQLIITSTKTGLATVAAFLVGLVAWMFGVIVVVHVTGWALPPMVALLAADVVLLGWGVARSPQLRCAGAVGEFLTDGRTPSQLEMVLERHTRCLAYRLRAPRWWLGWVMHAGYAMCAGLVVASVATGTLGVCTFVLMIALRFWTQRALGKQMAAAVSAMEFMGWASANAAPEA